ncbi:MAG: two-component regulator propeller domain-containing protein [Oscillochloridaceae bacterium]|nr:histidine kinase [Chloroflexaceae bacterium]MDW8388580.1 two-component regulator propeller domain-containing protein [Oscillochloridaceae bacterium]
MPHMGLLAILRVTSLEKTRRWATLVFVALMLLAPTRSVVAQAPARPAGGLPIRMLGIAEGLPHPAVYAIARDRFGFLWFGTLEGLARYDGHRFVVYRPDPGNPNTPASAQIDTLYTDRAGNLWIGTFASGLNRYDPLSERFTLYRFDPADPASLSSDAVRAICEDGAGGLWVGTLGGGLNRLDPATGRFTRYHHDPADPYSLSDDDVTAILDDGRGGLWVATAGGLNRFDPATGRFIRYRHDPADPASLGGDRVATLLRDSAGALWVGVTGAGLYRYDEARNRFTGYRRDPGAPADQPGDNVVALAETSPGQLWVATYGGGLARFDVASGRFTDVNRLALPGSGLATNSIESLLPGADGLLWVGTENRGVALVDLQPGPFTIYRARPDPEAFPDALWPGVIRAAVEDNDGALWLGVADSGVARFDRQQGVVRHYRHDPADPHSPAGNRPQAMLLDRSGRLWIGYHTGLDRFDHATGQFVHYPANPDDPAALSQADIFDLYESRDGAIWIGTRGGGLNRLDPATGRFSRYRHDPNDPASISSDNVGAIVEDQWGNLWLGHEGAGVSRLDRATGRFTNYRHEPNDPNTPGSNTVLAFYADPAGNIWAAAWNSGLDRIDPATGRFTRYTVADGLLSGKINGIQPDDAGNLWLTSNQGLMRFDPRTGKSVAYTPASAGLPPGGFALNGSARTRAGEIVLGGFDSLVTFFPREVRPQTEVAPVVFTNVLVANRPVALSPTAPLTTTINAATELTLFYRDRVLSLEFTALDYRAPEAARYRYRLVGFEPEWVEVDSRRRVATYTNLDPGAYTFEVQAANGEGVWGTQTRRLRIIVVPPWWQTWWFTLLAGATVVASVGGGVGLRLQGEKRQRRRLEAEVAARTAALTAANAGLEGQVRLERTLIMSLDLDTLLGGILEQIGEVAPFSTAAIFTVEDRSLTLRALRSRDLAPASVPVRLDLEQLPQLGPVLAGGRTQVLHRANASSEAISYLARMFGQPVRAQTWLVAPLVVQERVIGALVLAHPQSDVYGASEVAQIEPFVSPVALALENERLRQQARSAAMLEERARMARELHDAVTQTLFSASLIAEALPEAIERDRERAARGAAELRRLTAGALAEMRTLLLELRPRSLTELSLGRLVQILAASLCTHSPLTVTVTVENDCTLAPEVQLACYRIVQEALNNVVKHAAAARVEVTLDCTPAEVLLRVRDDGRGFDPARASRGGLGLDILRERASEIGAQLTIETAPDAGTTVLLHWQARDGSS